MVDRYLRAIKYTTKIILRATTTPQTSNSLILSHISDCTRVANSAMVSGGNLAQSAETSSLSHLNIGTSHSKAGRDTGGADPATSNRWSNKNVYENHGANNNYPPSNTVKPLALIEWLVQLVTPPGGLLLDPFAGTGTTGIAAMRLGVVSILVDNDPRYWPHITAKIEQEMALR